MSTTPVSIRLGQVGVGHLEFLESASALRGHGARRTADGFIAVVPARVSLNWQEGGSRQPMVSNLRVHICVDDNSGTELGMAFDHGWYTAMNPRCDRETQLEWRGSLDALNVLEVRRNGAAPRLRLECFGEVCWVEGENPNYSMSTRRGAPERIYGSTRVEYDRDAWIELMNMVGVIGNILVEVPLPHEVPADWREIFQAVREAQRALAQGGDEGWKGCIVAVRGAFEKWQAKELENGGPGWVLPNRQDREARSKVHRMDAIRWHVYQLAHLSAHTPAREWRRQDAVLALACVSALLGARDP